MCITETEIFQVLRLLKVGGLGQAKYGNGNNGRRNT